MEQLSLHIEYLLLRHDCVIVPGLGAFINVRESARKDLLTGRIHPMTREVRFNGVLTHDDGLLANSFSRREGISFPEGRELLRKETASLSASLEQDGEATLGHLGTLHRDGEGRISFRPFRSAEASAYDLGYLPASASPVAKTEPEACAEGEVSSAAETEGQHSGRVFDTDRNYYIGINKIFARTAACLMLSIGMLLSLLIPGFGSGQADKASVVPVEEIVRKACRIDEPEKEAADTTPQEETFNETPLPYHLIVATFRSHDEAAAYVAQHSVSSYRLQVVPSRRMWRVSAKSAATATELQNVLNDKTFKAEYGDCWIWEDKKAR